MTLGAPKKYIVLLCDDVRSMERLLNSHADLGYILHSFRETANDVGPARWVVIIEHQPAAQEATS